MTRRVTATFVFALVVLFGGCNGCGKPASGAASTTSAPLKTYNHTTPSGVRVYYPKWLDTWTREQAEIAIDTAGVPEGWIVEVVPASFEHPLFPDKLLIGLCLFKEKRLLVGVNPAVCTGLPPLPSLKHEIGHAETGDPECGHFGY